MENPTNSNSDGVLKILTVIYLTAAFGAYFLTFVFSRLARIKDMLGL